MSLNELRARKAEELRLLREAQSKEATARMEKIQWEREARRLTHALKQVQLATRQLLEEDFDHTDGLRFIHDYVVRTIEQASSRS